MNRCLYTALYHLLLPFIFFRLYWRSFKAPDYAKRWGERLGFFKAPQQAGGLWLHSVSVGETIAAAPLIKQIQQAYPNLPVTITTMTPTGSERVRALFGDSVFHVYVPYDLPWAVNRFLRKVKPTLALIMETELWPNLIHCSHRQGVRQIVMNARLSERSARGYQRFPKLVGDMLDKLDLVVAQSAGDGERLIRIGLPESRLRVSGSIKYDIDVPDQLKVDAEKLRREYCADRPIWIAASTHAGEDEQVLEAHRQLLKSQPELLLLLVPRHPERFNQVAELCQSAGMQISRRSKGEIPGSGTQVMLGDTMGELMLFYGLSDVAFVGGSLVETGGHNFLEPAALGIPVLSGPHRFNFSEVSAMLLAAGALLEVKDSDSLAMTVSSVLTQQGLQQEMSQAGRGVVMENRGAQQRLFEWIKELMPS